MTRASAEILLSQDVASRVNAVNQMVPLSQNQFDALVWFDFQSGEGNFAKSTLLKDLNNGKYGAVPADMIMWTNGGIRG